MNEHDQEDDWIRLGQSLRDYQPAGRPDQDFAALQVLQKKEQRSPRRLLAWLGMGMLLLVAGTMFILQPFGSADQQQAHAAPIEQRNTELRVTSPTDQAAASQSAPGSVREAPAKTPTPEYKVKSRPKIQENSFSTSSDLPEYLPGNLLTTSVAPPPPALAGAEEAAFGTFSSDEGENGAVEALTTGESTTISNSTSLSGNSSETAGREAVLVSSLNWPVLDLGGRPVIVPDAEVTSPSSIKPVSNHAEITINTGLSTHWRGSSFLAEPDQGIYFSIGAQQRIGRFSVGGRFGYRGHNMNLEVLEGAAKPWSHYEDKTNEYDDELGEEVEYTYVGVVNGYKGVEFSLLLGYHLSPKASLQVGGRYSLPSLDFRRTVHSSHDGDVTGQPNPYHFFATEQPLVKTRDYGALIGGQYSIGKNFSLEAMLHLGMVDLIEDEGERMNRFNHSSSVSFGISYRLH